MSQRILTQLVDDLDESEAVETVVFGLDGNTYEIDLNEKHAAEIREALAEYVGAARRAGGPARTRAASTPRTRRPASSDADGPSGDDVRTWAREQGLEVNARGRLSSKVLQAYHDAH